MKNYGKLTAILVFAWFVFAVSASALGLFKNALGGVGIAVGLAAMIPLIAFFGWFGASKSFREFTLSVNPQTLTFAQTWRVLGLVFVVLEAHHRLPAMFACLPATATSSSVSQRRPSRSDLPLPSIAGCSSCGRCSACLISCPP